MKYAAVFWVQAKSWSIILVDSIKSGEVAKGATAYAVCKGSLSEVRILELSDSFEDLKNLTVGDDGSVGSISSDDTEAEDSDEIPLSKAILVKPKKTKQKKASVSSAQLSKPVYEKSDKGKTSETGRANTGANTQSGWELRNRNQTKSKSSTSRIEAGKRPAKGKAPSKASSSGRNTTKALKSAPPKEVHQPQPLLPRTVSFCGIDEFHSTAPACSSKSTSKIEEPNHVFKVPNGDQYNAPAQAVCSFSQSSIAQPASVSLNEAEAVASASSVSVESVEGPTKAIPYASPEVIKYLHDLTDYLQDQGQMSPRGFKKKLSLSPHTPTTPQSSMVPLSDTYPNVKISRTVKTSLTRKYKKKPHSLFRELLFALIPSSELSQMCARGSDEDGLRHVPQEIMNAIEDHVNLYASPPLQDSQITKLVNNICYRLRKENIDEDSESSSKKRSSYQKKSPEEVRRNSFQSVTPVKKKKLIPFDSMELDLPRGQQVDNNTATSPWKVQTLINSGGQHQPQQQQQVPQQQQLVPQQHQQLVPQQHQQLVPQQHQQLVPQQQQLVSHQEMPLSGVVRNLSGQFEAPAHRRDRYQRAAQPPTVNYQQQQFVPNIQATAHSHPPLMGYSSGAAMPHHQQHMETEADDFTWALLD